jgi:hypothetical protein
MLWEVAESGTVLVNLAVDIFHDAAAVVSRRQVNHHELKTLQHAAPLRFGHCAGCCTGGGGYGKLETANWKV